jgi:DNA-binding MarR family transcriptional regulator
MKTYFTKVIKQHGLHVTPEQWAVLVFVFKEPGTSQTEIAKRSLKDKTNVTRILDVLEKNGYITRKPDAHDRRRYRIYLTNDGETVLQQLIPIADDVNKTSSQGINEQELLKFKTLLNHICTTLEELL